MINLTTIPLINRFSSPQAKKINLVEKVKFILENRPSKVYDLMKALSTEPIEERDPQAEVYKATSIYLPCTDNDFYLEYGDEGTYSEILFNEINLMSSESTYFHFFLIKTNLIYAKVLRKLSKAENDDLDVKCLFKQDSIDLEFIKKLVIGSISCREVDNNNLIGLSIILYDRFMAKNPDMNTPEYSSMVAIVSVYLARSYLSDAVIEVDVYLSKFPGLMITPIQFTHCCTEFAFQVGRSSVEEDDVLAKYLEISSHPFFSQILDGSLTPGKEESGEKEEKAEENKESESLEGLSLEGVRLSSPSFEEVEFNFQGLHLDDGRVGLPTEISGLTDAFEGATLAENGADLEEEEEGN